MTAWNFPEVILLAVALTGAVTYLLIRAAGAASKRAPDFECDVCGRRQHNLYARQWRYCPFCGAPKDARGTQDLPRRASR